MLRTAHPFRATLAICVLLALLSITAGSHAATIDTPDPNDPYRQIRIQWDEAIAQRAALQPLRLETMDVERDAWIEVVVRDAEIDALDALGIRYEIIHADLVDFYSSRMSAAGGDFGIFHTYSETVEFLDQLHTNFPDITTDKIDLGTTWEGRTVWAMKISDNPNIEETDEPEVLFDAAHHAREIMTIEVLIDYMTFLCENYGIDPEATELVDTRQIWFIPIVNPDGVVHNEFTNPNGGGSWRKNRRDDLGSCVGVDLNRNYPYEWGHNNGSSSDPCATDFRGPAAGSEAEVQGLMSFINQHEFVTHNSYHSVVGVILYPWAYTANETPDNAVFAALAEEMASESGYGHGQPIDAINYLASGGSFDWTYGDTSSHPKIFSFSTEVDGSGWWPAESEVPGLLAENHYSNIFLTRAAGVFLGLTDVSVVGGDGNGRLDPGETADLVSTVANLGALADATGVTLTLASDDAYIQLTDASGAIGSIDAGASADASADPFTVAVDGSTPAGHRVDFTIEIREDTFVRTETITLTVGQAPVVYSQNYESGSDWVEDDSHSATTGAFVRIDPNQTSYQPGDDTTPTPGTQAWVTGQNTSDGADDVDNGVSATRSPIIDLSGLTSAQLDLMWFHGQRDAGDDAGDFFDVSLSNDGGATYPVDLVAIGDEGHSATWRSIIVDLEDSLPLTSQMRIRVRAADGTATGDIIEGGIDDVYITDGGSGNEAPGAPTLVSPADGSTGLPASPTLIVENAVDAEGNPLTYTFRVYSDALLTTVVAEAAGVAEGAGQTSWTVSTALSSGEYFWRAHAEDAESRGPFMDAASFEVSGTTGVADASGTAPARARLGAPAPNPFAATSSVGFSLDATSRVRLDIFNVRGRHVRRLFEGVADAGHHVRDWDGANTGGDRAPAGVYMVQLEVNGVRQTAKLIRLP